MARRTARYPDVDDYRNRVTSFEPYENPVEVFDHDYNKHRPSTNAINVRDPHVVAFDARDRNEDRWPDANHFVLSLPVKLKNVSSIILMEGEFPVPAGNTEPYMIFSASIGTDDIRVVQSARPPEKDYTDYVTETDGAFAIIPCSAAPGSYVFWNRQSNAPAMKQFHPPLESLERLEFDLAFYDGTAVDTSNMNVSFRMLIIAGN